MSGPLDYTLCDQTVTVYRRQEAGVLRKVIENCYLQTQQILTEDTLGVQKEQPFLLIVPARQQCVFPGDRIVAGVGDEGLSWQDTAGFLQVQYAQDFYWQGTLCHTEAGRKG